MNTRDRRARTLAEAWVGDAVLGLYIRSLILREKGKVDSADFEAYTSNQALAVFGDPSEVEADIGRIYEDAGLAAAFARIEERLMPVFRRQVEKRRRALGTVPSTVQIPRG